MRRTHHLKSLRKAPIGAKVVVQGWIHRLRDMGRLAFIDLRDQYGIVQVVVPPEKVQNLSVESVIEVEGILRARQKINPKIPHDNLEISAENIRVINRAQTLPFVIDDQLKASEETRLKYRYLDLRRPLVKQRILQRAQINQIIRNFLIGQDFVEIETPFLTRSTPEGARDFLVPSRLKPHYFYALPQSPQLLKQLLMVANFDRYFQIVKSFRDEDLRIDRQPEFSQLDLEMAFGEPEDVMAIVEKLIKTIFRKIKNKNFTRSFRRLTYDTAMEHYGTDKPDLRFKLSLVDVPPISALGAGGKKSNLAKALIVPRILTKNEIATLKEVAHQYHLSHLNVVKYRHGELSRSSLSQLTPEQKKILKSRVRRFKESTILVGQDQRKIVLGAMGALRNHLGRILELIPPNSFQVVWITDFPLFEWSEEEKRYVAAHNPFTMPHADNLKNFDKDFAQSKARSFDLVINGYEIGSGAQRIDDPKLQERMFKALRLSPEEIETNFKWFTQAYRYGAPYHSGIALGLDRLAMILSETPTIREVIAFPKNALGYDLMMDSPALVKNEDSHELTLPKIKRN